MEKYIREHSKKPRGRFGKVRKWLLGCLTPAFAVCLAVGLFLIFPFSSGMQGFAASVTANPLINSNIGKHSEWYYGFTSVTDAKINDVTGGYANWFAQLGVDTGVVKHNVLQTGGTTASESLRDKNGKEIDQQAREHQLVQASSYKEGGTDKVFIINSPEEAAKVWTEAVEYALGQSKDSPFKVNKDGAEVEGESGLRQTFEDQSKDPITGAVQKIPGDGVAHGNYFADPYTITTNVNGKTDQISGQIGYKGQYITVKLNCDWYAKDILTNIAFALGNKSLTPLEQKNSDDPTNKITHDERWITTFNWAKDEDTFNSYWLGDDNWADTKTSRSGIRKGYSESEKVKSVRSDESTVLKEQKVDFTTDGHGYTNSDGYYASYDLSTMADQTANCGGNEGFNISSPFSYGRINVPTGAYIVLDLNGHTISRGLTEESNKEIAAHGSILKSKYEYDLGEMDALNKLVKIYNGETLGDVDGGHLYGNELCYYGSVMTVQPKARLEIVDSTAFERASDGRIDPSGNTYTTNHKGTVTGGCTDEKYYVYMDNDLGVEDGAYFGYNSNEGKGGAVHVNASGELVVHSGTFKDNQAQFGGAFYALSRAAVLVYNGYFVNNYATLRGGATYVASASRSVFTFYDGVISHNRAADGGGGVYLCDNAYVNLHGGYITYNQAGRQGGGVFIGANGEGLLENVNITQNVAGEQGGGIYVHGQSKFKFAGSLIVTQNKGDCGKFSTRDTVSDGRLKIPYVLRLTVDGKLVVSCGWDGSHGQYRYDWKGTATSLESADYHRAVVGTDKDYPKEMYEPAAYCKHDETGKETRAEGAGVHNYTGKADHSYPMWSLGDAANKEYNCIGGVIWTNKADIGKGGKDNNVYLAHSSYKVKDAAGIETTYYSDAKIIIAGQLFKNGIGAQIGVTLDSGYKLTANAPTTNQTDAFTTDYNKYESSVEPHLYFTSDDSDQRVVWNGGSTEATFGTKTGDPTDLTWEITGYLYGQTSKTVTIKASGDDEISFTWEKNGEGYHPDGVTSEALTKEISSFKWTGKTMMFDHKMFEVTKVVAKGKDAEGKDVERTWDINDLTTGGHAVGVDYTFHYLLAAQGAENEASDGRLVYAGDYSFRMPTGNYSNATYTIHINQLGVGVSAYEVKDGENTWHDKENIFKGEDAPSAEKIKDYLQGALYYRGTPYDFVLDKAYTANKDGKYDGFTGAVMKFVYANTDFFGSNVEIDFGAVDFELEYYWRELTDSSQQDLEKTNYFLHAGFYEVRGAHEVATTEGMAAVDYMKNNIAFESEMHLPIQRVSVSVWLEANASIKGDGYYGYTYKDGVYTTKQILYFNNNNEAGNDPELDKNVVVSYYDFDDYMANGSKAKPVGIQDMTDGVERWGVKDAGKYVVHVSLNTQMWVENGDPGKDDFTERGKPYNDYIFTSNETQRLSITPKTDEQGRKVEYEFAYYFFIQPAVVTSWENDSDPRKEGAGHLNFQDRTYDATDTEPAITGKMKSATEQNAYYSFGEFTGDTAGVYVRYLKKTAENTDNLGTDGEALNEAYQFTYAQVEQYGAKSAEELQNLTGGGAEAAIKKWFQEKTKFKPVDAGDYWILVWFRGVSPTDDNKGSGSVSDPQNKKYTPVTNFKGVYIGTYTISPVEVTVSGSLSYTYDGSSYERARFLAEKDVPKGDGTTTHYDDWYESIFFLVQDGITTPNELVVNQHADTYTTPDTYQSWEGGKAQNRSLRDLWGGNNTYNDAVYYKSRFTLGNVTVTYTNEEFKQHDIEFGIGLYAFKTKTADQGVYHLTTVGADENGKVGMTDPRVNTEPTNEGVTWIITYKPKDGTQTQAFNTSTNFVINTTTSFLEVTIGQKDIGELAGDITKVGKDIFTHWKNAANKDDPLDGTLKLGAGGNVDTGIKYPFAGNNWKYEPDVEIKYQPFYYKTSMPTDKTAGTGKTAYGNDLLLVEDMDFGISWMNNSNASTDTRGSVNLTGKGNYTGTLTLNFTITPAQIAVKYAGVGYVPQYDKTAHGVNVTYANVEDGKTYQKLKDEGILVSTGGSGDFAKPTPDASVYTITYKARTRTAEGFGGAAGAGEITDSAVPINAGVYDVKIVLGSNNYQFVKDTSGSYFTPVAPAVEAADGAKYSNAATGSHTILPAVVSFAYGNSGEIYNRQTHTPQIKFTNVTYQQHSDLGAYQNVVPVDLGNDYEVQIAPVPTEGEPTFGKTATDAGEYYVLVKLKSHNYCFDLELVTSGDLIVGYKDGATGENYPESRNDKAHSYSYSVHVGDKDYRVPEDGTTGTTAAVANFVIKKATITLDAFKDSVYNRGTQPQTPVFSNTERNNQAVPTKKDETNVVGVNEDEFYVTYTDNNIITPEAKDSRRDGLPFSAELYSVQISLTKAGAKNFRFATQTIAKPNFTHDENKNGQVDSSLLSQRLGGKEAKDDSIIIAPFLINRVDISVTQLFATDVYNAQDHFADAGAAGIALTNWVSAMFQYGSSEAIEADDLTVDVTFTKGEGPENTATVHYTPTSSDDTVEYKDKKDYSFTDFAKEGFFTHVATYTVTVEFSEESFYITNAGADEKHLSIPFTYTITPAQISFSLGKSSIPYDTSSHKQTYPGGGVDLTNARDEKVLPKLASGDTAGVGEVAVAYGYSGWAGNTIGDSKEFKNVGTYTVTLTLQANGDFQFADGNYSLSRTYTIDAMDISKEAKNFSDAVFTPDEKAGHDGYKIPAYHYTGGEIQPEITLTHEPSETVSATITLKTTDANCGLQVAYTDNINAGPATATLTGINNFTGTRVETFYVLPAIVKVTATDGTNKETFDPNTSPDGTVDGGSLTFSYNKTLQLLTFDFVNLCNTGTKPTNADYTVKYYKADDWDEEHNKPKDTATPLDAAGVTDSGDYYVWFEFTKGGREYSNFVFYKEKADATNINDMFDAAQEHLFRYGFKVTVTPANIEIHLAEQFKDKDGKFTNTFPYTATDYTTVLNSVTLSGENGVVPEAGDYSVKFYTVAGDKASAVLNARNADDYYLAFLLTDTKGNYKVTAVYAGSGENQVVVNKVGDYNGNGYYSPDTTLKNISVHFVVETAKIEVYLSDRFLNADKSFNNSFGYDRSDWTSRLNSVIFKNELPNGVVPSTAGTDYEVTFSPASVVNAGSYTLKFELTGEDAQNFVITHVRAGKEGTAGTDYVELTKDTNYTTTDEDVMRAFEVAFSITAAQIAIRLSDTFASGSDFINSFVYTRANRYAALSVISISNANNVIPNGNDYTVTFKTDLSGEDTTTVITDVGKYYLIFKFKSTEVANNYEVTAIYAGDGTVTVPNATKEDDKGYYGTMEEFSVKFDITRASITVHIAGDFNGGDKLNKEFGYNKTNQSLVLSAVQFANAVEGGVIPAGTGYVTFKKGGANITDVTNVGTYTLNFALKDDEAKNFVIAAIYAGGTGSAYTLKESEYTKGGDPFTAFSIAFEITPAKIQIHLTDQFMSKDASEDRTKDKFVGSFTYNKSSWATALGSVTLTGENGIVPINGEYTVVFMLKDEETVSDATNVGNYRLVFELIDTAGNYVITGIYAGKDESFDVRKNASDNYKALDGTIDEKNLKQFQLAFEVIPAKVDLYLNAFLKGKAFNNSFVYDGTDQSTKLGIVEFKQDNNIVPIPEAYTVTFFYNSEEHRKETDDVAVYDVGKYTLYFRFTDKAGGNYELRNIYAGSASGDPVILSSGNWSAKEDTLVKVNFELTPSVIDVFFSSSALKDENKQFVNKFYYNRNDWTGSFGSIYFDAVEGGTVPQGSQYSVVFYGGTVKNGKEEWDEGTTLSSITGVGRYSVTFRLSNYLTRRYPDVKHYNNFTIRNVYAGGTSTSDSVMLDPIDLAHDPTGTDGYRKAKEAKNNVYITLVFDIKPNVVHLSEVSDVIFSGAPQDAGFSFEIVDELGAVLPELGRKDFGLVYDIDKDKDGDPGNAKMDGGKPYFAGAYTVTLTLTGNFVFEKPDGTREETRNFHVTPVVLSAFLGYKEGDEIQRGELSLTYDGLSHEYQIYTEPTAANVSLDDGVNVYQVQTAAYNGWAGKALKNSDDYKNAGTYTVTLSFYILKEGGSSTGTLGGNFCFGTGIYATSLTYSIVAREITADDVTGIQNGDRKVYNGKPQTNGIEVLVELVKGAKKTKLELYDNSYPNKGDYSISNTTDINVGAVTTNVIGMHNFSGTVNLSYVIDPAKVTATIDETSLPYNAQEQSRAFTFENKSDTGVLPAYNTNEDVSDYTIAYTYRAGGGILVKAPRNAGEYTVTVTLKNSSGIGDSSNFTFDESLVGKTSGTTATFTFTITKAEIYLGAIPDASYTGEALSAKVGFVNAANPSVVPSAYEIFYDEDPAAPTHVKTDGKSRTPIAYTVKVTLLNKGTKVTDLERDLDNFVFVVHEGSSSYAYDTKDGAWGQEDYKITPAVITGSLSVTIEGVDRPDSSGNTYNAKPHMLDVVFRNVDAGYEVIPKGTKGGVMAEGLAATYDFTAGVDVLYTLTITFAPNYGGFTTFDGVPVNAGSYLVAVALKSADFSFADGGANSDWTYVISNAKIGARESVGKSDDTATFSRTYQYAPDDPHDITLTAEDFIFVEDGEGYNVKNATFTFTSCTGAAYTQLTDEKGLAIGYRLTGAGEYTVTVTVDAPNHDRWDITIKITVNAVAIKLVVRGDAHFEATYGEADAYTPEKVLEQVLQFIREGKIEVENIGGSPDEKAETLKRYGFTIRIHTPDNAYSGAHYLKAGDYGLAIGSMEVGGFTGNFVVFKSTETTLYAGNVFTVKPLAIEVSTDARIEDLRYNGRSLVSDAASCVIISNLFEGDDVSFGSVNFGYSESGNFNNGTVFDKADAIHVGHYWVHVFSRETATNGLSGDDSANYMIEVKDGESPTIRYSGKDGVYVAFDIKRREVELAIADSTSTYGDADAVYGTEGAKKFNFTNTDAVLAADFGSGEKAAQLKQFVLDLLALFDGTGKKLDRLATPYPGAGSYTVKLDPNAGKTAEGSEAWVLGDGKFEFDEDYILRIDGAQSGTHVIAKRAMRVSVNDYSAYYGEELKENGFEGSEGNRGFRALDEFVEGDNEEDLAIIITRDGAKFTSQGTLTDSNHWVAMTYQNGLKPYSTSANYEVTFLEDSGNYIIMPRPVIVLIHKQSSVYGEPRVSDLTGATAWDIYGTIGEGNMGYAPGESRVELHVTLSIESVVNDTASAGVYENVIKGSCGNTNYKVTFRNWVTEGGKNEPGKYEGGDYEITRRTVAIAIGSAKGVYGTDGLHAGMKLSLVAPVYAQSDSGYILQNASEAQWKYNFDQARYTILQQDLGYLTFYLGKADPANADSRYATVGDHAIVGVWGFGYDDAMTFKKSYDVKFIGAWEGTGKEDPDYKTAGVFTVTPADILQRRDSDWLASGLYRMYREGEGKTTETGWYSLGIGADYLIFAGDYADAAKGTLVFVSELSDDTKIVYRVMVEGSVRATIAYFKPVNTTQIEQEVEKVGDLWSVHSVGVWTMQVTIEAENHTKATFTYTFEIEAVVAKVMLNTSAPAMEAVYGDYEYILPDTAGYAAKLQELPLTAALHDYLEEAIMYVDGLADAYPGTNIIDWIDMILDNCRVEVAKARVSTSGMLEAGRYHLRIVADSSCGFTVAFVDGVPDDDQVDFSGYDRLIINQKELGFDWIGKEAPESGETAPELRDGAVVYTYSSYNYHFDPLFTQVIASDLVDDPTPRFFNDKNVLCTPHDVGTYRITVDKSLKGEDAGNYKLPASLEIELHIVPMEVVVTLRDMSITYGDVHLDLLSLAPVVLDGVVKDAPGAAWLCDKLGVYDGVSALSLQIRILDARDNAIERQSDAGVYRIVGSSDSKNYHVTFRSETDGGKTEAVYTVYRSDVTFEIGSLKETYGKTKGQFTYRMTEGKLAPWDAQPSEVGVSLSASCGDKRNVGSYAICGTWTNKNYNVLFTGDWKGELPADYLREDRLGHPTSELQGAGTYTIGELEVHLTMQAENTSVYGDVSTDGALGTKKFEDELRKTFQLAVGYDLAPGDTIADLKIAVRNLPASNNAGPYEGIFAEEDYDPNYIIVFDNGASWTVTPRTVIVTLHTQRSTYGDAFAKLANTAAFWEAENLAPWHEADPYSALAIELGYKGSVLAAQANVGTYKNAIEATPTENLGNYTFVYHNDDGETALGTYEIERRTVTVTLHTQRSTYGDKFAELGSGAVFWEAKNLAPWHEADPYSALGIVLGYDNAILGAQANAGTYKNAITAAPTKNTGNYTFVYRNDDGDIALGTYVVERRTVTVTLHTQHSTYGDAFAKLANTAAFWEAENLAPWHEADPYSALAIELGYDGSVLAAQANVGTYKNAITALPTKNTENYNFVYRNDDGETGFVGTYEIERRTVTVTLHTQHSAYGDEYIELGSGAAFWEAENLAPWHEADPYSALGIVLGYDDAVLGAQANAGTYRNAITADPTLNTGNYTFVYRNDEGIVALGTYVVDQRKIVLEIGDFETTFGDHYEEDEFNALIVGGYTLAEGSTLASWDAEDPDFVLGTVLTKAAGYHANVYSIRGEDTDDNYEIEFVLGNFTIRKAANEWLKHFSLSSMNEGETPDEDLLSASAKFGSATVKYYYDELCTSEVTGDLSSLPKSKYYAKVTVNGTNDYFGLEEVIEFAVNESFLVVNGGLDVTPYVCIFASQFIILTFALIFIRRKKSEE